MYDVAIIGGGPSGSTLATLLKKYKSELNILILERERFPREHVGESLLPPISPILNEMGCWDRVEQQDFPLKIGATYKWGNTQDLWDFEFIPVKDFVPTARPGKFEGQRRFTAFQVDRGIYDKLLLDFAEEKGIEVRQETKVSEVVSEGNRISKLKLANGEEIEARYYVDCSGNSALIRRTMGVEIEEPGFLRNIAIWSHWANAEWGLTVGAGATRTQIMSLGYGWLWFIPISSTRTSIGLVVPADYHIKSGKKPEELYKQAISEDPLISKLTRHATWENDLRTTKDWSYIAKSLYGDNWFLAGESAGFADPILTAGLTIAHSSARELAYTILALEKGEFEEKWLKDQYEEVQKRRVGQHIQFANFWYTANGCFTDLREMTREIAREAGLELDATSAFQWLGSGGFLTELHTGFASFSMSAVQDMVSMFLNDEAKFRVLQFNQFKLNLEGAKLEKFAVYDRGRIEPLDRYTRDGKSLLKLGFFNVLIQILESGSDLGFILHHMVNALIQKGLAKTSDEAIATGVPYLESLLAGGWVEASFDPTKPKFSEQIPRHSSGIKKHEELPSALLTYPT